MRGDGEETPSRTALTQVVTQPCHPDGMNLALLGEANGEDSLPRRELLIPALAIRQTGSG
jgi:hypothetical protein